MEGGFGNHRVVFVQKLHVQAVFGVVDDFDMAVQAGFVKLDGVHAGEYAAVVGRAALGEDRVKAGLCLFHLLGGGGQRFGGFFQTDASLVQLLLGGFQTRVRFGGVGFAVGQALLKGSDFLFALQELLLRLRRFGFGFGQTRGLLAQLRFGSGQVFVRSGERVLGFLQRRLRRGEGGFGFGQCRLGGSQRGGVFVNRGVGAGQLVGLFLQRLIERGNVGVQRLQLFVGGGQLGLQVGELRAGGFGGGQRLLKRGLGGFQRGFHVLQALRRVLIVGGGLRELILKAVAALDEGGVVGDQNVDGVLRGGQRGVHVADGGFDRRVAAFAARKAVHVQLHQIQRQVQAV